MSATSPIEWTDATWNPIVGCSIVSPGCTHCYAMRHAARIERMNPGSHYDGTTKKVNGNAVWTGELALAPDHILHAPLSWRKPKRVFVNSMGDLFHEDVPDQWIDRVFAVMAMAPRHTFQVLTKRAERMRKYLEEMTRQEWWKARLYAPKTPASYPDWPLANVWLGVSAEDQTRANERVPRLLQTPAAVRFVSAEPLLGPIHLTSFSDATMTVNAFTGLGSRLLGVRNKTLGTLDWVIVGGESGAKARPMHPDWARSLRDQCAAVDVPFFFKQWGEWAPSTPEAARGNPRSGWLALAAHPHAAKAAELYPHAGASFLAFVGKKAAGRLLDGVEHNAMPVRI